MSAEEQLVAVASVIYLRSGKCPTKLEVTSLLDLNTVYLDVEPQSTTYYFFW